MERRGEKRPHKTSVPQFGGWENKPKGVAADYSMVFNQARENKKNHKIDSPDEVIRLNFGNDQRIASNTTNHRHGHGRGRGSPYDSGHNHPDKSPQDDPPVMKRPYKMSVPQFGGWDKQSKGATDYSLLFFQARENKKNLKTYLTRRDSIRNDSRFAKKVATKHHRHGGQGQYIRCSSQRNQRDYGHPDPPVMGRGKNVLSYMNWCSCKPVIRP